MAARGKVEHKFAGSYIDISDYIADIDKIPYINRNRDYSKISDTITVGIKFSYPNAIALNDDIRISLDGNIIFEGYVNSVPEDWNKRQNSITVTTDLLLLDNYYADYNTLHPVISNTLDVYKFNPHDYSSYPNVQVLWLLQCIFQIGGYTLDVSAVENVVWANWIGVDILIQHFCMDEGMLYCLNQDVGTAHSVIDNLIYGYASQKITLLQLVNVLFPFFGFGISSNGNKSYKLVADPSLYQPADNDTYSLIKTEVPPENIYPFIYHNANIAVYTSFTDGSLRDFYYRTDPSLAKPISLWWTSSNGATFDVNGNYSNININILDIMKNLYIGSRINNPGGSITPDFLLAYTASPFRFRQRKLDTGFIKHELNMPANLSYYAVNQNLIDIKSESGITSDIIQEEFV